MGLRGAGIREQTHDLYMYAECVLLTHDKAFA